MLMHKLTALENLLTKCAPVFFQHAEKIHASAISSAWQSQNGPRKWLKYNDTIFPPQDDTEIPRPAVRYKNYFKNLMYINFY